MLSFLIVIIVLGIILEAVSLRRDPDKVEFDYTISTGATEPGAAFKIQSIITNKSRIPISYLMINEIYPLVADLPDGVVSKQKNDNLLIENICRLKGRQRKKVILETSITKRGLYSFTSDSIEFGDFLGFRELSKKVYGRQEIIVYPGRISNPDITEALANFCGDITARRFLIRDPVLTAGYREYSGREPMKDISWLQSARRGEIMVREYEHNRELTACVIMSVEGIEYSDEKSLDDCCAAARGICEKLLENGVPVRFFTNALLRRRVKQDIWKCDVSSGYVGGLLEGLGCITAHACSSLDNLLECARRDNDEDTAYIVILPACSVNGEDLVNRFRNATGQEVMLVNMGTLVNASAIGADRDLEEEPALAGASYALNEEAI